MTLISPISCPTSADAEPDPRHDGALRQAAANVAGNLAAIRDTQPELAERIGQFSATGDWTYARDGALSARADDGTWLGGCSVPRAAARAMLKKLDGNGTTACFLQPFHAAALRVALDQRNPEQAIVAVLPDDHTLLTMLHCEDFSFDIAHHRLWFIAGESWTEQLQSLFTRRPGLPTPTQFIRLRDGNEDAADALIEPARQVIQRQVDTRGRAIAELRGSRRSRRSAELDPQRTCFIAPSRFRLWDDAGHSLGLIAAEMKGRRFDSDDPASASPLALAQTIAQCDAVVGANAARADAAGIAPLEVPWITWLTTPRVPPFRSAGPHDRLILAEDAWCAIAEAAGWSAGRIYTAAPPPLPIKPLSHDVEPGLTVLCNTVILEPPAAIVEMSSHRLLWELIRDELLSNPFLIDPRAGLMTYLDRWLKRSGIAREAIDARLWIDRLISQAYAQGIVRVLLEKKVPLRLFGDGWREIAPSCWRGRILTRDAFHRAVQSAQTLLHVWPTQGFHAIDFAGRPVLRMSADRQSLDSLQDLAAAAQLNQADPHKALSPARLGQILAMAD